MQNDGIIHVYEEVFVIMQILRIYELMCAGRRNLPGFLMPENLKADSFGAGKSIHLLIPTTC